MPTKPRTAKKAAASLRLESKPAPTSRTTRPKPMQAVDGVLQWDQYVEEAASDVEPWRMQLPDGEILEVGCPSSELVEQLTLYMVQGDTANIFGTLFGEEHAETLLNLTAKLPFTSRVKLVNDVMLHYNITPADLPESPASST